MFTASGAIPHTLAPGQRGRILTPATMVRPLAARTTKRKPPGQPSRAGEPTPMFTPAIPPDSAGAPPTTRTPGSSPVAEPDTRETSTVARGRQAAEASPTTPTLVRELPPV